MCIVVRFVQILQAVRMIAFVRVEPFFVSGARPQVNAEGAHFRLPVTVVTYWECLPKKELDFGGNKPRLNVSPRPGPGSSGPPVSGSPSTPGAGGPLLAFQADFNPARMWRGEPHRQRAVLFPVPNPLVSVPCIFHSHSSVCPGQLWAACRVISSASAKPWRAR